MVGGGDFLRNELVSGDSSRKDSWVEYLAIGTFERGGCLVCVCRRFTRLGRASEKQRTGSTVEGLVSFFGSAVLLQQKSDELMLRVLELN